MMEGNNMPYIKDKDKRKFLDSLIFAFTKIFGNDIAGNLNYFLFKLAKVSCNSYWQYRDFIGELEATKLEIYRRQVAPYEDKKIKENGDVE